MSFYLVVSSFVSCRKKPSRQKRNLENFRWISAALSACLRISSFPLASVSSSLPGDVFLRGCTGEKLLQVCTAASWGRFCISTPPAVPEKPRHGRRSYVVTSVAGWVFLPLRSLSRTKSVSLRRLLPRASHRTRSSVSKRFVLSRRQHSERANGRTNERTSKCASERPSK